MNLVWDLNTSVTKTWMQIRACVTFSLARSSSNMSWISSFQSSWREWNESGGISSITCRSRALSCSSIELKLGLLWGSWSQHSENTHTHSTSHTRQHIYTWHTEWRRAREWTHRTWAERRVQDTWMEWEESVYSQPLRKPQPDHQYLCMELHLSTTPTTTLHNWHTHTHTIKDDCDWWCHLFSLHVVMTSFLHDEDDDDDAKLIFIIKTLN